MAKLDKLITYAYLREELDIPNGIEDHEFEHKIYRAQEMLRMLMGDEFFKSFLAEYKAGTFTGANGSLYDPYVKQFVAWQTGEYWTVRANFKPTNAGFRVHTEENSVVATDVQMGMLIKDAKQQAQYYKNLLVGYLDGNPSLFPLYKVNCKNNNVGNTFHVSAVRKKSNCESSCRTRHR